MFGWEEDTTAILALAGYEQFAGRGPSLCGNSGLTLHLYCRRGGA